MSLTEDPWRLSAGRDHILCGAFKKRPLGGTGHIRGLAHFPEGQKIIRCTEPNSTNPIHNYPYGSGKLCHFPRKWNYYIETSINNNKIKTLRGTMAKMISPSPPTKSRDMWLRTLFFFCLLLCSRTDLTANRVSLFRGGFTFGLFSHITRASTMTPPILVCPSLRHILI